MRDAVDSLLQPLRYLRSARTQRLTARGGSSMRFMPENKISSGVVGFDLETAPTLAIFTASLSLDFPGGLGFKPKRRKK